MPDHWYAPDWSQASKVHDWRNHVPECVRILWSSFSPLQKQVLWAWAEGLAQAENWD